MTTKQSGENDDKEIGENDDNEIGENDDKEIGENDDNESTDLDKCDHVGDECSSSLRKREITGLQDSLSINEKVEGKRLRCK